MALLLLQRTQEFSACKPSRRFAVAAGQPPMFSASITVRSSTLEKPPCDGNLAPQGD